MASNPRGSSHRYHLPLVALLSLILVQSEVSCYQYKVGDLDAWGVPFSSSEQVYDKWSSYHNFTIGDSLLFLYPPSEDSLIQVTEEAYNSCNLKDPILALNDGNSLFNITSLGAFFFTSGVAGHCEKSQKLRITVGNVSASGYSPGPSSSPSYPTVFGSIPQASSTSSSPPSLSEQRFPVEAAVAVGFAAYAVIKGLM
ncbi:hypothetical protein SAY87_011212 [Trapa incisa]|uniref:Phytocyanin domain-containing protein n=1 Tax=Trapa incisa TaxID=236973 RepID=A0AAN7GKR2_9MYRT|nr:hypothetical protein SAY87_011212 [Trapa incisa]